MKTRVFKSAGILFLGMLMVTSLNAQRPYQGGRGLGPCGGGYGPGYGPGYGLGYGPGYDMNINQINPGQYGGMGLNQWGYAQYGRVGQIAWLDLTDEQQTTITSLRTEHYKVMTPLWNKMAELKVRERTLLSEEIVDMQSVNNTINEQTDLMNIIRKIQTEHQVTVKSILTDEQVMKLQQRRQYAQRNGFRGNGGRRGAGMGRGYRGW